MPVSFPQSQSRVYIPYQAMHNAPENSMKSAGPLNSIIRSGRSPKTYPDLSISERQSEQADKFVWIKNLLKVGTSIASVNKNIELQEIRNGKNKSHEIEKAVAEQGKKAIDSIKAEKESTSVRTKIIGGALAALVFGAGARGAYALSRSPARNNSGHQPYGDLLPKDNVLTLPTVQTQTLVYSAYTYPRPIYRENTLQEKNINGASRDKRGVHINNYLQICAEKIDNPRIKESFYKTLAAIETEYSVKPLMTGQELAFLKTIGTINFLKDIVLFNIKKVTKKDKQQAKKIIKELWKAASSMKIRDKYKNRFERLRKAINPMLQDDTGKKRIVPVSDLQPIQRVSQNIAEDDIVIPNCRNAIYYLRNFHKAVESKIIKNRISHIVKSLQKNISPSTARIRKCVIYRNTLELGIKLYKFMKRHESYLTNKEMNDGKEYLKRIDFVISALSKTEDNAAAMTERKRVFSKMLLKLDKLVASQQQPEVRKPLVQIRSDYSNSLRYINEIYEGIKNQATKEKFELIIALSKESTGFNQNINKNERNYLLISEMATRLLDWVENNNFTEENKKKAAIEILRLVKQDIE